MDEANKLRSDNPDITITVITYKRMAAEILQMPHRNIYSEKVNPENIK